MMTNAARINTNRSKNSRNNTRGQQQYANNSMINMSKAASAKKSTVYNSDIHNLSP